MQIRKPFWPRLSRSQLFRPPGLRPGAESRAPPPSPRAAVNEEQAVLKLQQEWIAALRRRDVNVLGTLIADDYVGISQDGMFGDKNKALEPARSASP